MARAAKTLMPRSDDPVSILRRRARRLARRGEFRKAAIALRELACVTGRPAAWVRLGDMLTRARRFPAAIDAFKQGLYLHRQAGANRRATTVARMILALDPGDVAAARLIARAA